MSTTSTASAVWEDRVRTPRAAAESARVLCFRGEVAREIPPRDTLNGVAGRGAARFAGLLRAPEARLEPAAGRWGSSSTMTTTSSVAGGVEATLEGADVAGAVGAGWPAGETAGWRAAAVFDLAGAKTLGMMRDLAEAAEFFENSGAFISAALS